MRLGVNWTSSTNLAAVGELLRRGSADFCEILIDNFLHHEPSVVREVVGERPVAFHVMFSRFIERDEAELAAMGARLRLFAEELKPLYISDHITRFSVAGRSLALLSELDYEADERLVISRAAAWQDMVGARIHFENFPSVLPSGLLQPAFFSRVLAATGAGILFDLSNSLVAQANCGAPVEAWLDLAKATGHMHASGFRRSDTIPPIVLDSHDVSLAEETHALIKTLAAPGKTLVIERDANIDVEAWDRDLIRARGVSNGS